MGVRPRHDIAYRRALRALPPTRLSGPQAEPNKSKFLLSLGSVGPQKLESMFVRSRDAARFRSGFVAMRFVDLNEEAQPKRHVVDGGIRLELIEEP